MAVPVYPCSECENSTKSGNPKNHKLCEDCPEWKEYVKSLGLKD